MWCQSNYPDQAADHVIPAGRSKEGMMPAIMLDNKKPYGKGCSGNSKQKCEPVSIIHNNDHGGPKRDKRNNGCQ